MKTSDNLIAGKALIADREGWIQGNYAADKNGVTVNPTSVEAVCFCSVGAAKKVTASMRGGQMATALYYLDKAAYKSGAWDTAIFNDNRTHSEVMEMWDLAIDMAVKAGE